MIATILPGSENFHAVGYNERKVSKGTAQLLEMRNLGAVGVIQPATPDEKVRFLQRCSSRNDRVRKAQFHVAISCKGHEMTEAQLLDFTHQYLQEMGYAEPGQPWLIYAHHDTDKLHLHVVTSRVAPDGHKINHHHERRRSQVVIDKLMGINREKQTQKDIEASKQYHFSSFAQFKAILVSMGYEVYKKEDKVFIKKGGRIQEELPLSVLEQFYKQSQPDRACNRQLREILKTYRDVSANQEELKQTLKAKLGIDLVFFGRKDAPYGYMRNRQLREILKTYRDVSANQEELKQTLKAKLGIDLVFFGRKDAPYGYMLVDHAHKRVIHGARILSTEELLDFATPDQRFERIERFMAAAIDRNNRIHHIEQFHPTSETERDFLCKIYKVDWKDLIFLSSERPKSHAAAVKRFREMFNDESVHSVRAALREEGFKVLHDGDTYYAIDFQRHPSCPS